MSEFCVMAEYKLCIDGEVCEEGYELKIELDNGNVINAEFVGVNDENLIVNFYDNEIEILIEVIVGVKIV